MFVAVAGSLAIWPMLGHRLLATDFVPGFQSYAGRAAVLWTHVVADSLIAIAFFAISATLIYLVYRGRHTIPFDGLLLAFGLFLIACALAHLFSVFTAWVPVYVLSGSVKMITAVASLTTAILLPFAVPRILTLVTAAQALQVTHDRLRMAMESGKTVGWDWDLDSGRNFMFGDLPTVFGIPANTSSGTADDFRRTIHPDDRVQLEQLVNSAKESQRTYFAEFRVIRTDEKVRWVSATGKFQYASGAKAQRMLGMAVDITDRKSAEESMRQKDIELTEAQRLARVGSWQWFPETDTVWWSKELYLVAGLDPSLPAPSYRDHPALYTAESWARLRSAIEECLRAGLPYELDLEIVRPDGTTRWLTARGEAQRDASGRINRLRGTVLDITERKRAQDSLALFRRLIDGSNDAIQVIDPETTRFLDVNERACSDLGYSREELLTMSVGDISVGAPAIDADSRSKLEGAGSVIVGGIHRRKDGSTFPVEASVRHVRLDREYKIAIVRDISDRKRAEAALRDSEELLRLAVQAGRMFAYSWDAISDVIVRSGESAEILGIDEKIAFTGKEMLASVYPEDREKIKAAVAALTREKPFLQISYRMIRPDHSIIWLERNSRAHFDENGKLLRIVGMVADITKRKLAEEELAGVSGKLIEAQEAERSRIARELHDDIAQRLALLSVTIDRVAILASDSRGEVRGCIDELNKQAREISSDVQALSHQLHSASLEHLGLVAAMRGFCMELSSQHDVEIDFRDRNIPQELPSNVALCFFRVMQEGLHNAIKHSGVRRFIVEVYASQHVIELSLHDDGVGFDPEVSRGGGLGLTSMRERLKLVEGELSIVSKPRQGTTVHACAPLHTSANLLPMVG
jgi:PAS domain S-box-containing protein